MDALKVGVALVFGVKVQIVAALEIIKVKVAAAHSTALCVNSGSHIGQELRGCDIVAGDLDFKGLFGFHKTVSFLPRWGGGVPCLIVSLV